MAVAAIGLAVEASLSAEPRDPLWMKDLKKHDKFLDAVHDQEALSENLGIKNPDAKRAEQSEERVDQLQAADENSSQQDLGESQGESVQVKREINDASNEGELPDSDVEPLHEIAKPQPKKSEAQDDGVSFMVHNGKKILPAFYGMFPGMEKKAKKLGAQKASKATSGDLGESAHEDLGSTAQVKMASNETTEDNTAPASPATVAEGDVSNYEEEAPGAPAPVPDPAPPPSPLIPEAFTEPKQAAIPGYPIQPNLNTFMFYGRMVSFYLYLTEADVAQGKDRHFLKIDDEKMILNSIGQDGDKKFMSFKLERALAYTGEEAYGQKPFCYSLRPAYDPDKYLVMIEKTYFSVKSIPNKHLASIEEKRAASFCVVDKKANIQLNNAISLTAWDDVDLVVRAVGKYASLGLYVSDRPSSLTPESATFVVTPAVFNGMCWQGVGSKCTCEKGFTGDSCTSVPCKTQQELSTTVCSSKGICDPNRNVCLCGSGNIGSDCQHLTCPTWGEGKEEKTCNHRGSCNGLTGNCVCDHGWSGKSCEKGFCPTTPGVEEPCSGRGTCAEDTGICKCNKDYWGRACQNKKCGSFYPTCSNNGKCQETGQNEGRCDCDEGASGDACQMKTCPVSDCSGHGFCNPHAGTCKCFQDWFGSGCSDKNCLNGCSGHGTCQWKLGTCMCAKGYGLEDCSERTCPGLGGKSCSGKGRCNPLDGSCTCMGHSWGEACEKTCPGKCSENGKCNQKTGKCECTGLYFGKMCQHKACPNNCNGQGQCDLKTGTCKCSPGFVGEDCGVKRCVDDCNGNGKCVGDSINSKCQCTYPFIGELCKMKSCPNECSRNGLCNFISGECKCSPGFTGNDCATRDCPEKCNKRGQCIRGKCECLKPFSGKACEFAECPLPCGPHGTCDTTAGKCKCVGMYAGAQCNVLACPKNCNGHGLCPDKGVCRCDPGWFREDCAEHKCDQKCVHGACDRSTGECKCNPGYFTKDCSKKKCSGEGVSCNDKKCQCGGANAQSTCNYDEGKCECNKGVSFAQYFFSSFCAKRKCPGACDEKTQKCTCSGHGECDYDTGVCSCNIGFEGNNCAFQTIVQDKSQRKQKKIYLGAAQTFSVQKDVGHAMATSDVQALDDGSAQDRYSNF